MLSVTGPADGVKHMKLRALVLGAAALLAIACGVSATPEAVTLPSPAPTHSSTSAAPIPQAAPTAPEPLINLPADEGPHDSAIEWWYFNGLLTDDRGREYSYHYVTFQSEAAGTAVPHLLQASLGATGRAHA